MKTTLLMCAAVLLLANPHAARATEFNQVDVSKSSARFVSRQMGVPVNGSFGKSSAQIKFDPALASAARAQVEIDLASIETGSKDTNDEVVSKAWFNVRQFPAARFVSSSVKALGGDRYEAAGALTIKGRTQDVRAPFTVRTNGNRASFDGAFTIKRADFSIGDGAWADFGIVANEIDIKFHFEATTP